MASILFVHGAGHGAWCWHDHFTGWFEARGYTVAAIVEYLASNAADRADDLAAIPRA